MDDKDYNKYCRYSDINITCAASLDNISSPPPVKIVTPPQPPPEPPPSVQSPVIVETVEEHQYLYEKYFPVGLMHPDVDIDYEPSQLDLSHLLWDTHIFPIEELEGRYISPATILKLLATVD